MSSPLVDFLINNDEDSDGYSMKQLELQLKEFPGLDFQIWLDKEMLINLDSPFTDLDSIFIVDSRKIMYIYYFTEKQITDMDLNTRLLVEKKDNQPITLRQILLEISSSPGFKNMNEYTEDMYLTRLRKDCDIQYTCIFEANDDIFN